MFIPDLIADPWERSEPHLGYRLARPRYTGPNAGWEKYRVWGSQAYLLSCRLVLAALDHWDRYSGAQDARVLAACGANDLPLWYTAPCLVEHDPIRTAFDTPPAFAPDFDSVFRLQIGSGFQPPESVPGQLTLPEAQLLWRVSDRLDVLELGSGCGQSTVCLAQSARRVVSVDKDDQAEAVEWVRRYGCAERVSFIQRDVASVSFSLEGKFGLAFAGNARDAASVEKCIATALPALEPGGGLAFRAYPDPAWPDVRRVVDEYVRRHGWRRIAQSDFIGVFRT